MEGLLGISCHGLGLSGRTVALADLPGLKACVAYVTWSYSKKKGGTYPPGALTYATWGKKDNHLQVCTIGRGSVSFPKG